MTFTLNKVYLGWFLLGLGCGLLFCMIKHKEEKAEHKLFSLHKFPTLLLPCHPLSIQIGMRRVFILMRLKTYLELVWDRWVFLCDNHKKWWDFSCARDCSFLLLITRSLPCLFSSFHNPSLSNIWKESPKRVEEEIEREWMSSFSYSPRCPRRSPINFHERFVQMLQLLVFEVQYPYLSWTRGLQRDNIPRASESRSASFLYGY